MNKAKSFAAGAKLAASARSLHKRLKTRASATATSMVLQKPRYFKLRRAPHQMQKWGEKQHHPHTNWGDLFFDLIYVAAAFQLGALLKESVSAKGVGYFLVMFLTLAHAWGCKLSYDSRIDADDLVHKLLDVVEALLVATMALHISGGSSSSFTPLEDMTNLKTGHAWGFSVAAALHRLLHVVRWIEVYLEKETNSSTAAALTQISWRFQEALIYVVAAVLSNSKLVGDIGADYAAIAWAFAVFWSIFLLVYKVMIRKSASKETTIPMNIEYCLHRYGEWTMLMIGESILSLIVGVPLKNKFPFYFVFACGFFVATSLQFIHYATQPMEADEHAMRRKSGAGVTWTNLMLLQSACFVSLGVSLKILLKYATYSYMKDKYAILLCASYAGVYCTTQMMKATHCGLHKFMAVTGLHNSTCIFPFLDKERVQNEANLIFADDASARKRKLLTLVKIGTVVFTLFLPGILSEQSPQLLAGALLAVCVVQAFSEAVGNTTAVLSEAGHRRASEAHMIDDKHGAVDVDTLEANGAQNEHDETALTSDVSSSSHAAHL